MWQPQGPVLPLTSVVLRMMSLSGWSTGSEMPVPLETSTQHAAIDKAARVRDRASFIGDESPEHARIVAAQGGAGAWGRHDLVTSEFSELPWEGSRQGPVKSGDIW